MVSALMVRGLTHRYPGRGAPALDDLGLDLPKNWLASVLGPNGSGESTPSRILLRLLRADPGEVEIGGRRPESCGPAALAGVISYVLQPSEMPPNFSEQHTVVLGRVTRRGLQASPWEVDWRTADEVLEAVGMTRLGGRGIQKLSGGEWQLVLITCALCQGGQLLVLDEPISALDAGNRIRVLRRLRWPVNRQGSTVLLNPHQPNHTFEFADDILFLKWGCSPRLKPIVDLTGEDLSRLYDPPTRMVNLTGMPGFRLCVAWPKTRGDQ